MHRSRAALPAGLQRDFDPIETALSKFKACLDKSAARAVDNLWQAIAKAVDLFTSPNANTVIVAAGNDREWSDNASVTGIDWSTLF